MTPGRVSTWLILVLGLGLVAAPFAFQMFTRAPEGGDMITEFRPYMTTETIDRFRGHLDAIGAASSAVDGHVSASPDATPATPALATLTEQWPSIDQDMGDMLATMRADIGRFRGVSALPPFPLFPFFFVLPGVIITGLAVTVLIRRGTPHRGLQRALVVMGVGLIMAPAIFQMFTRAPGGAEMIDDFRPIMTDTRVTTIQGYFLTIGVAEGELRTKLLPAVDPSALPDARSFSADWPAISEQMAPMIGTMADNVENFAAVDALPPFWAFPWFFVAPGVLVAGLALLTLIRPSDPEGHPT